MLSKHTCSLREFFDETCTKSATRMVTGHAIHFDWEIFNVSHPGYVVLIISGPTKRCGNCVTARRLLINSAQTFHHTSRWNLSIWPSCHEESNFSNTAASNKQYRLTLLSLAFEYANRKTIRTFRPHLFFFLNV